MNLDPKGAVSLRRLSTQDLVPFLEYRSDPEVARYQGWEPMDQDQALAFLEAMHEVEFFAPGAWFQIGIQETEGQSLVGDLGVFLSEDRAESELGISLSRGQQGKGYAQEAIRECLAWIFASTPAMRVFAKTDERNQGARKLFRRLGFTETGIQEEVYKGELCREVVFVATRSDFATP